MTCTSHGMGYCLALTFGTLLSSQRTDAQKLNPSGHRPWLEVQHYAGFQRPARRAASPAALPGRAAQRENYTPLPDRSNPPPVTPDTASGRAVGAPAWPSPSPVSHWNGRP